MLVTLNSLRNYMEQQTNYLIFIVGASTLVVLLLIAMVVDMLLLYRNKKKLADKEIELRQQKIDDLLQRQEIENVNSLLKGQNEERRRIAQELHDNLGSLLFIVKLHYGQVEKSLAELKKTNDQSYGQVNKLLDEAVEEVRRISHDLYEGSLAKFGYRTAMLQLTEAIRTANALQIKFEQSVEIPDKYRDVEMELYRISQELLSNTLKHAAVSLIEIDLSGNDSELIFKYSDNGKGFLHSETEAKGGIGLRNIRSRAERIKGKYTFESRAGEGMLFTLKLELKDDLKN